MRKRKLDTAKAKEIALAIAELASNAQYPPAEFIAALTLNLEAAQMAANASGFTVDMEKKEVHF